MKYLDFDSRIVGCEVYKIDTASEEEIDRILLLENVKRQLIYVLSDTPLPDNFVQFYDGKLGSVNVSFGMNNPSPKEPKRRCSEYSLRIPTNQLYNLAVLAGTHSRFNRDDMISKSQYEQIFKSWIERDVEDGNTQVFTCDGGMCWSIFYIGVK